MRTLETPEFLTTRELADLLRIKERKVYELVAAGAVPVSRLTGKYLFPRDVILAWIRRNTELGADAVPAERPAVFAGSHDPLLDWALRQSGSEIATFFDGSADGLARLGRGQAIAAGLHLPNAASGWNTEAVAAALPGEPVVLVEWAKRRQGLVLAPGRAAAVGGLAALAGRSVVPRQPGSGSHALLMRLLDAEPGLRQAVRLVEPPARSEADVAQAVAGGRADAGLAVECVARQYRLDFVPLVDERYDLAVWRRDWFEPPMQRLLAFCRTAAFRERADELGGYDLAGFGTVRFNGP